MAKSPAQFAANMRGAARDFKTLESTAALKMAQAVTTSARNTIRVASGNGRLSGVGGKKTKAGGGAKVGARYDKAKTAGSYIVKATGPLHLLERDTKAHDIPKARKRARKRRVIVIPGVGVRTRARHPGTHGKHPFERGVTAGHTLAVRAAHTEMVNTLSKALGH